MVVSFEIHEGMEKYLVKWIDKKISAQLGSGQFHMFFWNHSG